nr:fructose bisphosphate aldolase [Stenotrophomonas sp. MMGLT7]
MIRAASSRPFQATSAQHIDNTGEPTVAVNKQQLDRIASGKGFIAALDQSGGSTPKALKLYGIDESAYSGDAEMFDLVHQMRARIVTSPAFNGERVLGAILFERTLDDSFAGQEAATYLWETKQVVPFLKIDKGLEDEADGVQLLKPIPDLAALLARAKAKGVFGTKERSVIKANNAAGIAAVLDQQFALGQQVLDAGLIPIIEPEVDIKAADKEAIEAELKQGLLARLDKVDPQTPVILKLTLPSVDGYFQELVDHPSVLKVVALSGGYARDDANAKLARNPGVIASFSRALTEGLSAQQSDDAFNQALDTAIESIYRASIA